MSYLKHLTLGASVAALLAACSQPESDSDQPAATQAPAEAEVAAETEMAANDAVETESDRLNAWFQDVFDQGVADSPMYQTFLGMKTNYDQWDDPSPEEALRQYEQGREQHQYMLDNFDFDALDRSAQISWRLAEYNAARAEASRQWWDHGYTFTPRSGPHMNSPTFLINNHRVDTLEDAEAYIGRLRNMGAYMDQQIANSRRSAEMGVYTPRWTYQPMMATSRNIITGAPFDDSGEDSPLMGDFRRKVTALELGEEETNRLLEAAAAALNDVVAPVYGRLIALFEEQEAVANDDDGVWKHPQGGEYYNHLLNGYTTMDISAEEIHQLGVAEVARIHDEMRAIMTQVGFEGSLQEFFDFMRTDEQFYYPNTDEGRDAYLADATAMIDTMVETLPQMFNRGQWLAPRNLLCQPARYGADADLSDGSARLSRRRSGPSHAAGHHAGAGRHSGLPPVWRLHGLYRRLGTLHRVLPAGVRLLLRPVFQLWTAGDGAVARLSPRR